MAGTQMNTNFMDQFYTTQRSPGSQDGFAWAPRGGGVQAGAYGAPAQPQYANYQAAPQYYPQQQPQQWPPQQPMGYPQQQGWGQQAVAYQQWPPQGPMGYPQQPWAAPGGYPGVPGRPNPMMGFPGSMGRPGMQGLGGIDLVSILEQFGGDLGDDYGDYGDYIDIAGPDPFAPPDTGVGAVVNRLASLVSQISDVINQIGTVVQTLVNKQPAVAVLPPAVPPATTPIKPAPATTPKDGSIDALLAALLGTSALPAGAEEATVAVNTTTSAEEQLINELLGAFV